MKKWIKPKAVTLKQNELGIILSVRARSGVCPSRFFR